MDKQTMEISPTAQRVLLSRELRALRWGTGLDQGQFARKIGTAKSSVCKIECGRRSPPPPVLRMWLTVCGVSGQRFEELVHRAEQARNPGWLAEHNGTVPSWFKRYFGLEEAAVRKDSYESEYIPGLLQIDCYTQAIARAGQVGGPSDSADGILAVRSTRHRRLVDREHPLHLRAVLNETVIRRPVGGRDVMREQLRHLVTMAAQPNVTLHVLPFAAGEHPAMAGSFTLLHFCQQQVNTVYLEHADGAVYIDRPEDVRRYEAIFGHLVHLALSEEASIEMIEQTEREL